MQSSRFVPALAALSLSFQISLPAAAAAEEESEGQPLVASGTAILLLEGERTTAAYDLTVVGPLFPLQPIVARLGGELEIGPLEQRHALHLGEITALFGPGALTLMLGDELLTLSQQPRLGVEGVHVPLDLLERTYGEYQGFEFSWDADIATLTASRALQREIDVRPEIVHLQGVTTVLLTFGEKPRYQLREEDGRILIDVGSDRLRAVGNAIPPAQALVEAVEISDRAVTIRHLPGTVAQSYELERPYRLVFELFRGTKAADPADAAVARPRLPPRVRDLPGINTIVIDPGHGGDNSGAISRNGIAEKDITLPIALSLKESLERALSVRVLLTRSGDDDLGLDDRSAIANQNKADLFISLHVNSSFGRSAHGAETFFLSLQASDEMAAEIAQIENEAFSGGGDASENPLNDLDLILWDLAQTHHLAESQRYARIIQEELNGALGLTDRGVKQAPFRVLRGAAMPAVLIELGFLSNPEEEERLQDPVYRTQLVDALVRATQRYEALVEGLVTPVGAASR